ncbi:hypothetical protein LJC26_02170 [Desulfovibrio sp. OttesenSCG-928-O18]|nr:hypothetical protein [Desulfovibrio sp. OttesenSCG-928-O18]
MNNPLLRFVWFLIFALFVWSAYNRILAMQESGVDGEGVMRLALALIGGGYFGWRYFRDVRRTVAHKRAADNENRNAD